MPAAETYFIAWKGRRDGPYTLGQLETLLKNGDIGLLHSVETAAGPVPLRQLLAAANPPLEAIAEAATAAPSTAPGGNAFSLGEDLSDDERFRFALRCGLCFPAPPLVIWVWRDTQKLVARGSAASVRRIRWLGAGLAAAGVLFWAAVWHWR